MSPQLNWKSKSKIKFVFFLHIARKVPQNLPISYANNFSIKLSIFKSFFFWQRVWLLAVNHKLVSVHFGLSKCGRNNIEIKINKLEIKCIEQFELQENIRNLVA